MNELEKLAEFIVNFKLDNAPSEAVDAAKICILDSFEAAVGACKDELIESIILFKTFSASTKYNLVV
ncbi:MAG: hypothetical protein WBJ92_11420 [Tepidanaerobacteraceae bacterium]